MGTTIMALKYDGGVIACADSSKNVFIQELPQEVYTLSIELQIKLTMFMNILSLSEAVWLVNHNKLSIN